jgi:hypothetical protein
MLSSKPLAIRPSDPVDDPNLSIDAGPNIDKIIDFLKELGINLPRQYSLRSLSKNMSLT